MDVTPILPVAPASSRIDRAAIPLDPETPTMLEGEHEKVLRGSLFQQRSACSDGLEWPIDLDVPEASEMVLGMQVRQDWWQQG